MKQHRTNNFDPNTSAKDRREPKLKSTVEDFPTIEQPKQIQSAGGGGGPVLPVREVLTATAVRRNIKPRHPFDIYEDQDEELRKLAVEDRMRGGPGSMSKMVREAIDDYIAKVRQRAKP